jgi:ribosome-binding protein aMBF1 (putative translation factor)
MRTIQENGATYVLVPLKQYQKLMHSSEMDADVAAFDRAVARKEEAFPAALFDTIDAGANPVRSFREYRKLSAQTLAKKAKISDAYLSQIETGKRKGSARVLSQLAQTLRCPLEELVS